MGLSAKSLDLFLCLRSDPRHVRNRRRYGWGSTVCPRLAYVPGGIRPFLDLEPFPVFRERRHAAHKTVAADGNALGPVGFPLPARGFQRFIQFEIVPFGEGPALPLA